MARLEEILRAGKIIPFFGLPSNKGKSIKSWDYKQRKNLVIYFFSGAECSECRQTLKDFADNYYRYRRLNAEVLAIGTDSLENLSRLAEELNLPFPVLSDPDGEAASRYTRLKPGTKKPTPSIFIADRYGSLEEEWVVDSEDKLPTQEQIAALLQLFELRCPE